MTSNLYNIIEYDDTYYLVPSEEYYAIYGDFIFKQMEANYDCLEYGYDIKIKPLASLYIYDDNEVSIEQYYNYPRIYSISTGLEIKSHNRHLASILLKSVLTDIQIKHGNMNVSVDPVVNFNGSTAKNLVKQYMNLSFKIDTSKKGFLHLYSTIDDILTNSFVNTLPLISMP